MRPSTTLLAITSLGLVAAAPVLEKRAQAFSGKGQIRLLLDTTHEDNGCLTSAAEWTIDESQCGVFTGTLTPTPGTYDRADIQSSTGGYLGVWENNRVATDYPKPDGGIFWYSLNFAFVSGGPYLGTGWIETLTPGDGKWPVGKEKKKLHLVFSGDPPPSFIMGWKAL